MRFAKRSSTTGTFSSLARTVRASPRSCRRRCSDARCRPTTSGVGGFGSNAVDADGNVYQCVIGDGKVDVFSPRGALLATVVVPQTMSSPELLTANLVIKPGTRDGYLVVGGGNGGFVYTFPALGLGDAQSNGGSAAG